MLYDWCNFEGVIHFYFVPNGRTLDADVYSQVLERVHELFRQRYPALINRNRVLLQQDNVRPHTTRTSIKNSEIGINRMATTPIIHLYFCTFRLLFRSVAHFSAWKKFRKD